MSKLALKRIRKAQKTKAKSLDLSGLKLKEIPEEISGLVWLEKLNLDSNKLTDISPLSTLPNLSYLDLNSNKLIYISPLSTLSNLEELNLRNNQLSDISVLTNLDKLKRLDIRNNDFIDILEIEHLIQRIGIDFFTKRKSPFMRSIQDYGDDQSNNYDVLNTDNEPNKVGGVKVGPVLTCLPPEIIDGGDKAIKEYLNSFAKGNNTKLHEAKLLILGDGGVGKTTLFRKLQNINVKMPEEGESTKGIDIHKLSFKITDDENFTINLWDFGGQEIYRATHQFFLSKRSLYILVTDTRREDTDFSYWLQLIELLGGDSPIIIVQNEKGGRQKQLDIGRIQKRFKNIVEVISLDLKEDNSGIKKLYDTIQHYVKKLPHVNDTLPKSWRNIRLTLEILSETKPSIEPDEYYRICENEGMKEHNKMLVLSQYFHDLGVFLHFQDDKILKKIIILQNQWATKAVYAILDDGKIINQQGKFNKQDANSIWGRYKYYSEAYIQLIRLMKNFELCYEVPHGPDETYIAPQLLNISKPDYEEWVSHNIIVKYHYKFMPKGLMARFIVRRHRFIDNELVWNKGVVLKDKNTNAEVVEEYAENTITVKVKGKSPKQFLDEIRSEFRRIHDTFGEKLEVDELIPCFCKKCREREEPEFYSYADLMRRKEHKIELIECKFSYQTIKVTDLLNFDHTINSKNAVPKKLFISYSKKDIAYLNDFKKHLSPLIHNNDLITWDDKNIIPGEEWDERIVRELNEADIIIFLVSADFLATDYILNKEVKTAILRHERKDTRVIPVIIRKCMWKEMEFSKLNALPRKGKSVKSYNDTDMAWCEVVEEIKLVLYPERK